MGILDQVIGSLGSGTIQRAPVPASQPGFPTHIQVVDGDTAYDTAAEVYGAIGAAGVETIIWERTTPAQEEIAWGFGAASKPANQGYMWFAMLDSGTDWSVGTLKLAQSSHSRRRTIIVAEFADSQLHSATVTTLATAGLLNKEDMIALPEQTQYPKVGEDSYLQLRYVLITAATTVDAAGFAIPVTKYN